MLKQWRLSIDFLMGVAAVGAAVVGSPLEGTVLIFLFSLSKALEQYAMGRTRSAIGALMELRPAEATRVDADGRELDRVTVERLTPGDFILVRPGERIAADGRVHSGRSEVDQAAITGESMPVTRKAGDEVYAATINQGGALVVAVTREAGETMLARIIRMVEEAQERRAPAQHFIDRFAHPYALGVVVVTALVAIVPPLLWDIPWADAFYRAMTLLVVASPCALVISTPSAILSGIANGARHGVLFKGGAHLDLAGTIDTVVFDKTGTLTVGQPRLLDMIHSQDLHEELREDGCGEKHEAVADAPNRLARPSPDALEMLRLAAAVEQTAEHHLARAMVRAASDFDLTLPAVEEFEALPGEGVQGLVEGHRVWVGNAVMAQRMGARAAALLDGWAASQTAQARSIVFVGSDNRVLGAMSFGDNLKPNAAATIRHLQYEGIGWIAILSGDHPDTVRAVAAQLGANQVQAGLLPHEKVEAVRILAEHSRGVAMVGDGVNDAPAMAAATLGIAMGAAGTDVAIETADVVLMSDEVDKVDYVIHLGRRARRVVRQNVYFSIGWMLMLVVLALTVGMPLPLAVVGHEGSTLLVAVNGLRLLRGRPHPPHVPSTPHAPSPSSRTPTPWRFTGQAARRRSQSAPSRT
jgi:Cd2+/Zn2+-exporting ATPase